MPAWDRSIDLFLNVGTSPEFVLLASRSSLQPAERPALVSGDKHLLRLWLLKPGTPGVAPTVLAIAAGDQIVFAGKASPAEAALLFSATNFSEVNDADGLHYEALLDLTPSALRDAFGTYGALTAVCDVEVQNSTNTTRRSRQFAVRVARGVYTNEADPTPAEPAYPSPGAILTSGTDTPVVKRGTLDLVAGDFVGVAVAFATEFATPPTNVLVTLMKKAGAPSISADLNHDEIAVDGFTADLGAPIPDDAAPGDYKLSWLAFL